MNKLLLTFGLICQAVMICCLFLSVERIVSALAVADESVNGDVSAVTAELSKGYDYAMIGPLFGLIGLLVYFLTAKRTKEKKPWMRKCGLAVSALSLPLFPFGTILGGFSIHYFITKKSDFLDEND